MTIRNFVRTSIFLPGIVLLGLAGTLSAQAADGQENPATMLLNASQVEVGARAPAFKLETIDGETIDLADIYGKKAVYLKLWATWCIPCRQQMPHFENVYQHAGDDLEVIAVNAGFNDPLEDILEFREEYGIHMPIAVDDGTLAGTFNLRITPLHIVIGKDGIVKYIGQRLGDDLEKALQEARTAPPMKVTEYGKAYSRPHFDVGDVLPAETMSTSDGDAFPLQGSAGQAGTVLVFMIPWCEGYLASSRPNAGEICRQVREQVDTIRAEGKNVRWLGINSGLWTLKPDLAKYQEENGTSLPMALDGDSHLFRAFGVMSIPTVIVADASGKIIKRIEGYDPGLEKTVSSL